ncbi:sensor histidine kinase [Desulfitobacterium chlororespirans]|uniref:histidine kinase n=1 Tax=Desulfitobacterium chlororespirans DSM 11544 TaxID=1121395 RepID=A0A1M7TW01_9FIRM|nr:ATP-binding protein [Desulfitobacterium chlororespirans]SHN74875.1 HAMP domain-containing protein [Desulfitobacterium chlororespirans DSM 11544]
MKQKKKSITFKLFIITSLFFIFFTSLTMLLQTVFIENFYLSKKTKDFEANFQQFSSTYSRLAENSTDSSELLSEFQDKNNASTAVISLASSTLRIFEDKRQMLLKIAKKPSSAANPTSEIVDNIITYNMDSKMKMLINGMQRWSSDPLAVAMVLDEGRHIVYHSGVKIDGQNSLVGIAPIVVGGEVTGILTAAASLQPIGEAAAVIRQFYVYFYMIALVLIFALSLIYSKIIAKPLVTLNKTALKLSELDFSAKCPVNSQDEIGSLSATLNFLSAKLDSSISELKAANEKLREDIENEKKLDLMKNEFIAGVSHELKTPISLINSYAEGIKDNITNGTKREYYAHIIMDESKKMASLVEDMLDLSQLESGSFKLKVEDFSLTGLLNSIAERYSVNTRTNEKTLALQLPPHDLEVRADMFRIEQVLTNLVNNALKYTPPGGTISISAHDEGDSITIEVENPGEPIPEAELPHIWSKFYRIEKSRNKELGGTGLGLSIVKEILDRHGSAYGAHNTAYGVKFFFTLAK